MSADPPGCYCGLWQTNPEVLRSQGVPEGYCGLCQVCSKPGHTRHYPGPVPYTGAWCDPCYRRLAWRAPFVSPAHWLMFIVIVVFVLSLYSALRH